MEFSDSNFPTCSNQWIKALPRIKEHLYQYENVGHFIEEYKGEEIGQLIIKFLAIK